MSLSAALGLALLGVVTTAAAIIALEELRRSFRRAHRRRHRRFFDRLDGYAAFPPFDSLGWLPVERFGDEARLLTAEDRFLRDVGDIRFELVEALVVERTKNADEIFRGWVIRFFGPPVEGRFALLPGVPLEKRLRARARGLIWPLAIPVGLLTALALLQRGPELMLSASLWVPLGLAGAVIAGIGRVPSLLHRTAVHRRREDDRQLSALIERVGPAARRFAGRTLDECTSDQVGVRWLGALLDLERRTEWPVAELGLVAEGEERVLLVRTRHDLFEPKRGEDPVRRLREDIRRVDRFLGLAHRVLDEDPGDRDSSPRRP